MFALKGWVGLFLLTLLIAPARGADPVQQFLDDLRSRQTSVKNVRYKLTGTREFIRFFDEPAKGDRAKPQPIQATLTIDVANKKYRLEQEEVIFSEADQKLMTRIGTHTYDGKSAQDFQPREQNHLNPGDSDLSIAIGNLTGMGLDAMYIPVFSAHGILPTVNAPLQPDRLPYTHSPEEFQLRGDITHLGRKCTVFRTEPANSVPGRTNEIWVDSSRKSAVVRTVYIVGKKPNNHAEIEYQETPHGWLPKSWVLTWIFSDKVDQIYRFKVEKIEANLDLSPEEFTFPVRPGMIVHVYQYPEPGSGNDPGYPALGKYRIDESGHWIELERKGFTSYEGRISEVGLNLPGNSRSPWFIRIAIALGISSIAGLIYWRYRTRGQLKNSSV